jgi:DNA primase
MGTLVGISGRTVVGDLPRYKIYRKALEQVVPNYSFDKAKVLWGLDKFYCTAMEAGIDTPIVMCEGFKAAMWVYQCGIPTVVATFGTYLSDQQRDLLTRVANRVVLFLDHNNAGIKGTQKVYSRLRGRIDVKIAVYPETDRELQPDDLSGDQVISAIENSLWSSQWRNRNEQALQRI